MRFPDAQDCAADEAICYRPVSSPTSTLTTDADVSQTKFSRSDIDKLGRCQSAFNFGECVSVKASDANGNEFSLRSNHKQGKIMNIPAGRGWGGCETDASYAPCAPGATHPDFGTNAAPSTYEFADDALVRIRIWHDRGTPSWASGAFTMGSSSKEEEYSHNVMPQVELVPERVKVTMQVTQQTSTWCNERTRGSDGGLANEFAGVDTCQDMLGFYFDGTGAAQGSNNRKYREYGGLVYGYNGRHLQILAPTQETTGAAYGHISQIGDGWGIGVGELGATINTQVSVSALVWKYDTMSMADTAYIQVDVTDSNEPPRTRSFSGLVAEDTSNGLRACGLQCSAPAYTSSVMAAKGEAVDAGNLTYEIVGGNLLDAFRMSNETEKWSITGKIWTGTLEDAPG